jgi:hypothetical protein
MKNKPIFLLACPPKDKSALAEIGIIHLEVTPKHITGECTLCKCEVWIGPKQQEFMKVNPEVKVHCFPCAKSFMKNQQAEFFVASIGKGGAKYITKDGTIIAEGKD